MNIFLHQIRTVALVATAGVVGLASVAGPIPLTSPAPYTQNFNSLFNENGQVRNTPLDQELSQAAWNSSGNGSTAGGTSGSGWWQNCGVTWLRAADGTGAAGGDNNDVTSWGAGGSTERALGLGSSTSSTAAFGAQFRNNLSGSIVALEVGFTGEQWRGGNTNASPRLPDMLAFEFSTNATGLAAGTWVSVPVLNFMSPQTNAAHFAPLDGNLPANRRVLTATIPGLNIPPNATFFLRWRSVNNPSGNDGLGIDDFSLTPVANAGVLHHYQIGVNSPQTLNTPFTVTLTAQDALNAPVTTNPPAAVTLSSSGSALFDGNGNGIFGEPGDRAVIVSDGTATLFARADAPLPLVITATDERGITGVSSTVQITDVPAGISFTQLPATTSAGSVIAPAVVVVVTNSVGTAIDGLPVTILLTAGTGTLGGTVTRLTTGGAATFNDLQVSAAGLKTLRAMHGTLFADATLLVNPGPTNYNRIGILWSTWDPAHWTDYPAYINTLSNWGITYVSLNPTYFINTYAEGITNRLDGQLKTPDAALQKSVLKELIRRRFYINFRPHIDPIKYAMPLGPTRDNWNTDPGGKDWRGKFNLLSPTSPSIGYLERVILPSLQVIAEAIREAGPPVRPVRFDIGAELMDSMLNYPTHWQATLATVRAALTNQYRDVATNIVLGHNLSHHVQYLMRLPGHTDYISRIVPTLTIDPENQELDRPGISAATRLAIGQYIAGLDELSISQYLPLDIFNPGGNPTNTTPAQVRQALQKLEDDFVNEVLLGELQIPPHRLPVLHIGEYGMGIRGLVAPNVWDTAKWIAAGNGSLLLPDELQKIHAGIAMRGIIEYVKSPATRFRSFLLWMGGKPYDVLGLNSYSDGWYNPVAANALADYWDQNTLIPPLDEPAAMPLLLTALLNPGENRILLRASGTPGAAFRICASSALSQPRALWLPIHSGTLTNGTFEFSELVAPQTQRFYYISTP